MYSSIFKRIFDLIFTTIILVIISPILLISALLIKIDSKGPVFFTQLRMGKNKHQFEIIKFRTMTHKQRNFAGQTFPDDPEITRVGKFLRRFKIDELPQFFNVLMGDMSIVGPRPCLKSTYEKFKDESTDFRFQVYPGVTSNAGTSGSIYLSWPEKWNLDKKYVENVSFSYDLSIILKTIMVVFVGENKFKIN
ncbi:sugar transferase [Pararhodonellum marinum]|uniref:sugar transferase n=1 Tax=Pararhodonellum marinum TaxID=2755358 RepID=UPI00188E7BF4|nr:sugar transferase [Pararhodonellum marinum]